MSQGKVSVLAVSKGIISVPTESKEVQFILSEFIKLDDAPQEEKEKLIKDLISANLTIITFSNNKRRSFYRLTFITQMKDDENHFEYWSMFASQEDDGQIELDHKHCDSYICLHDGHDDENAVQPIPMFVTKSMGDA